MNASHPFTARAIVIIGCCATAFAFAFGIVLGVVSRCGSTARWESDVIAWVVQNRSSILTDFARSVTELGSGRVVTALVASAVIILLVGRRWMLAAFLVVATGGTALLASFTKGVVARDRPPTIPRLAEAGGHAFPSGHSAQAVACFAALAFTAWRLHPSRRVLVVGAALVGTIAALVGWSRVYLGVHWPSDILGGWLLAGACLLGLVTAIALVERGQARRTIDHHS